MRIPAAIFIYVAFGLFCSNERQRTDQAQVLTGLDNVFEYQHLFQKKRVGIVTNHTSYNTKGTHISEVFTHMEDVIITAFFGPEHGFSGEAERGVKLDSEHDPLRNVPIYSLYGKTRKPTPEMLQNVDVLVFDIQDIGTRFYTYIYNMSLSMEGAAEYGIPFVVLDRPNPLNGKTVEGNILEPKYSNYMGLYPIPVRYGMTMGELANMINGEGWLANGIKADLTVVPLVNWKRHLWFDETGLTFIKTSPNMPDLMTAILYPGICLLEGTNISEGRGTSAPFKIIGAPWIDGRDLARGLNNLDLPGVSFHDTSFIPVSIPGMAKSPQYGGRECFGVNIRVDDRDRYRSYYTGIQVINSIYQNYPDSLTWKLGSIRKLSGTNDIYSTIVKRNDIDSLVASWQNDLLQFKKLREKYLLYD
jgi:uncharacterized protein YbbC (DUF1343 family)